MTRINLIRTAAAESSRPERAWYRFRLLIVFAAAGVLHWGGSAWVASATEGRDSLRQNVGLLEQAAERARSRSARPEPLHPKGHASRAAARLRGIAASIPADLWLVSYREHDGEAMMRGISLTDAATRLFVDNLGAALLFERLEIIETTRAEVASASGHGAASRYEFQLKAILLDAALPAPAAG